MARGRRTDGSGYRLVAVGGRGEPLAPEQSYLSVWLSAVHLPSRGFSTQKFAPVVWAGLKHATFDGEQTLGGLFPNTMEGRPDFSPTSAVHVANLQLTPRMIAREQVTVDLAFGALRRKDYLAGALNLLSEIAASPAAAFLSAAAPVVGAISAGAQSAQRIKASIDDLRDNDKLRLVGAVATDLRSPIHAGRYALVEADVDESRLKFDAPSGRLMDGGAPLKSAYVVLEFLAESHRPDWMVLPDLNQAWRRIREAALAGADVAGAVDYFRVTAVTSPDLTRSDAQRLTEAAERKFSSVMTDAESFTRMDDPGDMAESLTLLLDAAPDAAEGFTLPSGLSGRVGAMGVSEGVFARALDIVLKHEGGFVDHPRDRGRATNRGVTQATYDAFRSGKKLPPASVKDISSDEIAEIYRTGYWAPARCHEMPGEAIAIALFDAAVNHGVQPALKMLQQASGAPELAVDGLWGEGTRKLVLKAAADLPGLVRTFLDKRETFYRRLVELNPSQSVFLKGWLKRVDELRAALGELTGSSELAPAPESMALIVNLAPLVAATPEFLTNPPTAGAPSA